MKVTVCHRICFLCVNAPKLPNRNISHNRLTGTIPESFATDPILSTINLSHKYVQFLM